MSASPIAVVSTSPYQIDLFLRSHLEALPANQPVVIYTNVEDQYRDLVRDLPVQHLPLGREARLTGRDLKAAYHLREGLLRSSTSTVLTLSPRGGFLGQIAAASAGVHRRLHIFTGQVWADMPPGLTRTLVKSADRGIGRLATHVAADSPSQARFLERERVVPSGKRVAVPHSPGSIRGVDLDRFRPDKDGRDSMRARLGITESCLAFVQLGRLTRAKGVIELADAYERLRAEWHDRTQGQEPRLFLVGPDEDGLASRLGRRPGITVLPFTSDPELLLNAMDVLVLASHREGFGSTIVEGAAVGLPAIGTDIVGVRDAVVAGETGWLVPKQSTGHLYRAMTEALDSKAEVARRGAAARERAIAQFGAEVVAAAYANHLMAIHHGELDEKWTRTGRSFRRTRLHRRSDR